MMIKIKIAMQKMGVNGNVCSFCVCLLGRVITVHLSGGLILGVILKYNHVMACASLRCFL